MGAATKLRIGVTDLSVIWPSETDQSLPLTLNRRLSSAQIRSSGQFSSGSPGGGGFGQDAQPGERIGPLVDGNAGNERPADPVKPVAPGDHVAGHLVRHSR